MRTFFHGWRRKAAKLLGVRPLSEHVLEVVANQSGVSIESLRSHPACKNIDSMDSLELAELVSKLTDEKT